MIVTCEKFVPSPHSNTEGRPSNCCKKCGRSSEAHDFYNEHKDEVRILFHGKLYVFKNVDEMEKNLFRVV